MSKKAIVIRQRATDKVVHRIDVTGKGDDQIARVEAGLAINFDWENNYFGIEQEATNE